ncbi:MAG: M28 family peptidase [Planctomycetes bacterium]|nr:M28 family peptidase [Planctomycetota bacterium]
MIRLTFISVLFILPVYGEPAGSVVDAPQSIRRFHPESTTADRAIKKYFEEAGPLAVEYYEHLTLLSNPWMGGREPGSKGSRRASEYIVWNLQNYGITPAFDDGTSWYQPFTFQIDNDAPTLLDSFVAVDDMALVQDRDYVVLGNSGSGEITAPVVCIGYSIEDGENGYTSFPEGTDIEGKIALILRYEPLDEDGASQWASRRFSPNSNIRDKMQAAVDYGAAGIILVNPPNCRDGRRGLENTRSNRFGATDIPVVQFSHASAELLISTGDLQTLQTLADAGDTQPTELGIATLRTEVEQSGLQAQNIGGVIQGRGDLAEEWVVVGGHYDHVGFGYTGTSTPGVLHRGADDNASGSAAVLLLARQLSEYYATSEDDSMRSILMLFFDAEEAGLRGSAHFVGNSPIDLEKVNAMINLDMVGSLRDNNLMLGGTGTAIEFETIVPAIFEASSLTGSLSPGGTGPSDHTNFYKEDVPVLFFFTGMTEEYHTPADQAYTVNPFGAVLVAELAETFALRFAKDHWLTFTSNTQGGANRQARMASPVRLGIHPSYSADLETGILLSGVSEGTSAADAGLQVDDVLLAWNDVELTGGTKLMELLRASAPDDVIEFTVQRGDTNIIIEVTLKAP